MKVSTRRIVQSLTIIILVVCINLFLLLPTKNLSKSTQQVVAQPKLQEAMQSEANKHVKQLRDQHFRTTAGKHEEHIWTKGEHNEEKGPSPSSSTLGPTELRDVFISVKTTTKFHKSRLDILLKTWFVLAREQTYFFTDGEDKEFQKRTNGHMINTKCPTVHNRIALCCKMAYEYDAFIESKKRWFCHVDDDTYINVPRLVKTLQNYNHTEDWYLGKPSLSHPIRIPDRSNPGHEIAFWFATGGAGFCISKSLALKMLPYASGGRLNSACDKIRLPDDCTVGHIICHVLGVKLTVLSTFHSHLEGLWMIKPDDFHKQITFSYAKRNRANVNVVSINKGFSSQIDPSRLLSVHCHLFPYLRECQELMLKIL